MNARSLSTQTLAAKMAQLVKIPLEDIGKFSNLMSSAFQGDLKTMYIIYEFLLICINPHFSCHCAPNYHGIHCATRSNDCSSGSNQELCGHGSCISDDQNGFKCICEQVRLLLLF